MSATDDFLAALNAAADEVLDWCGVPDTGARDIVNLIINLVGERAEGDSAATIESVIKSGYSASVAEIYDACTGVVS